MKTFLLMLLVLTATAGCVVVPAEPAVVGPPRAYVYPPPVVVVPGPGRTYYGSGYWYPHRHGYY